MPPQGKHKCFDNIICIKYSRDIYVIQYRIRFRNSADARTIDATEFKRFFISKRFLTSKVLE